MKVDKTTMSVRVTLDHIRTVLSSAGILGEQQDSMMSVISDYVWTLADKLSQARGEDDGTCDE